MPLPDHFFLLRVEFGESVDAHSCFGQVEVTGGQFRFEVLNLGPEFGRRFFQALT